MDNTKRLPHRTPRRTSVDGILFSGAQRSSHIVRSNGPVPTRHVTRLQQPLNYPKLQQPGRSSEAYVPAPVRLASATPHHRGERHTKSRAWKKLVVSFVVLISIGLIGGGGWIGWKFLRNASKVFGGSIASNIGALFQTTKLKGEDQGRINVLLAGNSTDDPGHGGADLTDSIMVASIDLKNNTALLLSIPRDLWVNIPGVGHQKINSAITVSNFSSAGYPNGGMGQLEQIVSQNLGIPINYYALINYTAFKDAVNAVGGITITIQSSDPRGLYDPNINKTDGGPLRLPNGLVTLNGQTALNLARARGDAAGSYGFPTSDFDRTTHQRQMLVALKQKATGIGVISNPVKIGQLFDSIGNNVQTDLNVADILRFIQLGKGISNNNIQSASYSYGGTNPLLKGYHASDGEDALIPSTGIDNFTQLQLFYQKLTSDNPVVQEGANVVVLNGTSITGFAKKEQSTLIAQGVDVTKIADASKTYATTIIDNSIGKMPATLALLKKTYGSTVTTQQLETSFPAPDFIVVLGIDRQQSTTNTTTSTSTQ